MKAQAPPFSELESGNTRRFVEGIIVGEDGRFQLIRLLGQGGMGIVWLAKDRRLNDGLTALKFLPQQLSLSPAALSELREETLKAQELSHPNIVRLHDIHEGANEAFISMEYVNGPNLSQVRAASNAGRFLTWERLAPIVAQLCDALEYAHHKKIVHRDLKPGNIMLDSQGWLKLADFGISRTVSDLSQVSMRQQAASGTPAYMSPQQMEGKTARPTDDIYSLGSTIYEMLTSKPPFYTGNQPHQVMQVAPPPMWERLSNLGLVNPIPLKVERIVAACLAKDPKARPQSAREVAHLLGLDVDISLSPTIANTSGLGPVALPKSDVPGNRAVAMPPVANASVQHTPSFFVEAFLKSRLTHILVLVLVAIPFIFVSIGVTWYILSPKIHNTADSGHIQLHNPSTLQPVVERAIARITYTDKLIRIPEVGTVLTTRLAPVETAPGDTFSATNLPPGLSINPMTGEITGSPQKSGSFETTIQVSRQRDNHIATIRFEIPGTSQKSTTEIATTKRTRVERPGNELIVRHTEKVWSAAFSPDGNRIVTGSMDRTACIWDVYTGKQLGRSTLQHDDTVWSAGFSPDGKRIVTACFDNTARLWDAVTGASLGKPMPHNGTIWSASFSPDGKRILTASIDNKARLWDATTGEQVGTDLLHKASLKMGAFSPDGTHIVTATWGSRDNKAVVWDAATGQQVGPGLSHSNWVNTAVFSPDSTRIVTSSQDKSACVWHAGTGNMIGQTMLHDRAVTAAIFSPDGKRVLTTSEDKTARLWDAETGRPMGDPLQHPDTVWSAAFSPDGTRCLTRCNDKTVRLWDVSTGKSVGEPIQHEDYINTAVFSPDGSSVLTASSDKTARLWDATTGKPLYKADD